MKVWDWKAWLSNHKIMNVRKREREKEREKERERGQGLT
jgi:hypothetical protein